MREYTVNYLLPYFSLKLYDFVFPQTILSRQSDNIRFSVILSDLFGTPLKNADATFSHAKKSSSIRIFQALNRTKMHHERSLYNLIFGSFLGLSRPGYPMTSEYKSLLPLKSLLHCSSQISFVFLVCSLSGHIQVYKAIIICIS